MGQDAESSASLYTSAESNLGDIVLGELEKSSFIALPGRGEHSRLMPSKPSVPAGIIMNMNFSEQILLPSTNIFQTWKNADTQGSYHKTGATVSIPIATITIPPLTS